MDKRYQLDLTIQDLRQAKNIIQRAVDRLEQINHSKSFTLNNLANDLKDFIEELDSDEEF
ncbi:MULTISPECIES: hypothetical protein [Thermoactinomyces]|uniref:Uncharacterized protein n=1 Tax=Thermoactinomyces daqus TaxID=1329516 RepID=A0A7W1XD39_9BACL|nr:MULTISPECIES: hypothetical protein [Thermoactinomyces]MBA4544342.1 hypothetical protein [Thermoactinomyces daqus]MBH8599205.1 hypothetical protein [Thermoactinomyces sp. CICC 10523]MBH8605374.1 hypothetical protein [Thermoactinomyces sp. CICC 10522]MBH8609402.1 hypothetical protein [Thermoactinomyces sp. CICC 10521]